MNLKKTEPSAATKHSANSRHDQGAYASWGLVIGAILGCLIGGFLGHWLGYGILAAGLGWVVGAFLERARS